MEKLHEKDLALLRRVIADGGERFMGYGDTASTLRLSDVGLLRWWQSSPLVARVAVTDAGREFMVERVSR